MSTRASIVVTDGYDTLWFYRHSDGYPQGALPTLRTFLQWVVDEKIRDNASQASGWLIILGAAEYHTRYQKTASGDTWVEKETVLEPGPDLIGGWKVGAYEPTTGMHLDINFLYEVDLTRKEIRVFRCNFITDEHGEYIAVKGRKIHTERPRRKPKLRIVGR